MSTLQHMQSLERARVVRVAAGELRRDVRAGRLHVADALADPRAAALTIESLLRAQRGLGPRRITMILRHAGVFGSGGMVDPNRRVRDLTGRQREAITAAVVARAASPMEARR